MIHPAAHFEEDNTPTDPYFPLQWYLRNTGQNGGKVHLDLNVQAAWDQGITGKNVTTAIMDDGKQCARFNSFMLLASIFIYSEYFGNCRRGLHAPRLEIQLCKLNEFHRF